MVGFEIYLHMLCNTFDRHCRSLMTCRAYRFLHHEQLEILALESVIKDIFQYDWISDSRVDEHRSVQSIVILNGAVTVTSYLICVFDTEAWRESACLVKNIVLSIK